MFDKLIESNSEAADFKDRRSYFMVSSIIVGALFLAAVVASIYAGDIGLGQDEFEISTMLPPVMPETEPPRPQPQTREPQQTTELPSRQSVMQRPEDSPIIPTGVSTVKNTQMARPEFGPFTISNGPETNGSGPVSTGRETVGDPNGGGLPSNPQVSEKRDTPAPPPAIKPEAPKHPVSIGVANGKAINLPKPPYPAPALAVNAQGKVDVQVTIDEDGKVIAARAVSGHPLLRQAAERAAWNAKFTPTLLSNVPVKVTGVIVYNFTRN